MPENYKLQDLLRIIVREGYRVSLDRTDHSEWRLRWAIKNSRRCMLAEDLGTIVQNLARWIGDRDDRVDWITITGPSSVKQMEDYVDVGPLAKAFEQSGLSASEVCRRLGPPYVKHQRGRSDFPQTSTLKRTLGLMASHSSQNQQQYKSKKIHIDRASAIIRALDRDPYEFGL